MYFYDYNKITPWNDAILKRTRMVYTEVYFQCSDLCLNVLNVLSFSVEYTCISKTFPLVYSWQVYSLVSDLFP